MIRPKVVPFYGVKQPYGFLSQFYPCKFTVDKITYYSAEQYMMSCKAVLFEDSDVYSKLHSFEVRDSPTKIKALGRTIKNFNETEWNAYKQQIVYDGNILKFTQNTKLRDELNKAVKIGALVEASPTDLIWGNGLTIEQTYATVLGDWPGLNLLGDILTKVQYILTY